MARSKPFDPTDSALREVVRHELTQVTGTLEYRVDHLLKAIQARAAMVNYWNDKVGKTGRAGRRSSKQ